MDLHDVPQPTGSGVGKQEALRGFCNQAVGLVGLSPVSFSLCPHFGAPGWRGKSGTAWDSFCWPSYSKGIHVCR